MGKEGTTKRRFGCLHLFLIVVAAVAVVVVICFFAFRAHLFPEAFRPARLSAREEAVLQTKLQRLNVEAPPSSRSAARTPALAPEAYSETAADRTIRFTEKELNALLAKNADLAAKVAIDLSPGLVSANMLLPVDPDLPVIGGKTLRVKAGIAYSCADGKPVLMLKGITVMGVPMPNAWLGDIKNMDLIEQADGCEPGFWKGLSEGIESFEIEDGAVIIQLKE